MAIDQVSNLTIPVIDISGYISGDSSRTTRIVEELRGACRAPGFFQIIGHDVPVELRTRLFDKVAQFYALPSATKLALQRGLSVNGARGYEAIGTEIMEGGFQDQKEGFMIGPELPPGRVLQGPNLWPEERHCAGFRSTMEEYFDAMRGLTISMCRAHRYPRASVEMAKKSRGTGAHTDYGAMTLLLQDDIGGLEVFHRPSATWNPVPYVEDAFIVNIADMMERWTNGRYMSTLHRVISPVSNKDRYSVAFFNEGLLDQVIECIPTCIEAGETPLYPPVTVEAHLRKRYADSYGENKEDVMV
ncbi:hypothetical protein Hte_008230 [Hypoxylon texense]